MINKLKAIRAEYVDKLEELEEELEELESKIEYIDEIIAKLENNDIEEEAD